MRVCDPMAFHWQYLADITKAYQIYADRPARENKDAVHSKTPDLFLNPDNDRTPALMTTGSGLFNAWIMPKAVPADYIRANYPQLAGASKEEKAA